MTIIQRIDNDGGDNPVYIGEASPGSAITSLRWRIQKLIYSGANIVQTVWADGSDSFNKRWDQRASYSYF